MALLPKCAILPDGLALKFLICTSYVWDEPYILLSEFAYFQLRFFRVYFHVIILLGKVGWFRKIRWSPKIEGSPEILHYCMFVDDASWERGQILNFFVDKVNL